MYQHNPCWRELTVSKLLSRDLWLHYEFLTCMSIRNYVYLNVSLLCAEWSANVPAEGAATAVPQWPSEESAPCQNRRGQNTTNYNALSLYTSTYIHTHNFICILRSSGSLCTWNAEFRRLENPSIRHPKMRKPVPFIWTPHYKKVTFFNPGSQIEVSLYMSGTYLPWFTGCTWTPFLHVQRGCGYTHIQNSIFTRAPRVAGNY